MSRYNHLGSWCDLTDLPRDHNRATEADHGQEAKLLLQLLLVSDLRCKLLTILHLTRFCVGHLMLSAGVEILVRHDCRVEEVELDISEKRERR